MNAFGRISDNEESNQQEAAFVFPVETRRTPGDACRATVPSLSWRESQILANKTEVFLGGQFDSLGLGLGWATLRWR